MKDEPASPVPTKTLVSPTKKQTKKPRDPNKPKQAMSAFFIYMNAARAEIKEGVYIIFSISSPNVQQITIHPNPPGARHRCLDPAADL